MPIFSATLDLALSSQFLSSATVTDPCEPGGCFDRNEGWVDTISPTLMMGDTGPDRGSDLTKTHSRCAS